MRSFGVTVTTRDEVGGAVGEHVIMVFFLSLASFFTTNAVASDMDIRRRIGAESRDISVRTRDADAVAVPVVWNREFSDVIKAVRSGPFTSASTYIVGDLPGPPEGWRPPTAAATGTISVGIPFLVTSSLRVTWGLPAVYKDPRIPDRMEDAAAVGGVKFNPTGSTGSRPLFSTGDSISFVGPPFMLDATGVATVVPADVVVP